MCIFSPKKYVPIYVYTCLLVKKGGNKTYLQSTPFLPLWELVLKNLTKIDPKLNITYQHYEEMVYWHGEKRFNDFVKFEKNEKGEITDDSGSAASGAISINCRHSLMSCTFKRYTCSQVFGLILIYFLHFL